MNQNFKYPSGMYANPNFCVKLEVICVESILKCIKILGSSSIEIIVVLMDCYSIGLAPQVQNLYKKIGTKL